MRLVIAFVFLLFVVQSAISAELENVAPEIKVGGQDMSFVYDCVSIARIYEPRLSKVARGHDELAQWLINRIMATCSPSHAQGLTMKELLNKCLQVEEYMQDQCARDVRQRDLFLILIRAEDQRTRTLRLLLPHRPP